MRGKVILTAFILEDRRNRVTLSKEIPGVNEG